MKFLNYVHNFRGIAILYVVVVHCISAFNWEQAPLTDAILQIIWGYGSVSFVFIAGYLFQYLIKQYTFRKYMTKKLLYVGLPYFLGSIPAIVYFVFFRERWNVNGIYEHPWFYQIVLFYLTGQHLAPYWFIPMIFVFYTISPLLMWYDRHPKLYYLLPVFIGISLIVPRSTFVLQNFTHFFSVYVAGMFFSHYRTRFMDSLSKFGVIIMMLIGVIVLSILDFYSGGYQAIYLQKLVLSVFYLALLYRFDSKINKTFSLFATTSFGIFFIHSYIISIIKLVYLNRTGRYFDGTFMNFLLFSLFIVGISTGIVVFLKKLFGTRSRYIIGS